MFVSCFVFRVGSSSEDRGIGFGCLLHDWAGLVFGAGIVDGDIQPSEAFQCSVDQLADTALAANIGLNEFSLDAGSA
jgi:hypothetical protein